MNLTDEFIKTRLSFVLAAMGKPVVNAYLWRQELGDDAPSESQIYLKQKELEEADRQSNSNLNAYTTLLSEGYDTSHGYKMSITDESYQVVSSYYVWIEKSIKDGAFDGDAILYLEDINNQIHFEKASYIASIISGYGAKCLQAKRIKPKGA